MKIWILSEGEPLPSDEGNVRLRRMGMLTDKLSKKGNEVHWFSSAFHHYKKQHRSTRDKCVEINNNLYIHLLKTEGYKNNVSVSRIKHHRKIAKKFLMIAEKLKKPDVILATMAPLEFSEAAVEYGKKNNIPVVIDIRDLWPAIYEEVLPGTLRPFIRPYVKYMERKLRRTILDSYSIVGVTPAFMNYGLRTANIHKREYDRVFHTSYKPREISSYKLQFNNVWSDYDLKDSDFIITFLGNFGKQFELDPIFEAAKNLEFNKKIKFVLCGNGENYEKYKKLASNYSNIIMPGWIEEERILTLLSATDIGVAPYRDSRNFRENTPNKFGEYLSASLPILVGVDGIMNDLITEYDCGFYYQNSKQLEECINKLFLNKNMTKEMSANAYKLYNARFNADKVYNEFANYLEKIATRK